MGLKLISADIDGTLLAKGDLNNLRPATKKTIEDLRSRGVLFGLASGRPYEDVRNMYERWEMKEQFDFLICWNGCELWDAVSNTKYEYNYLSKDNIKEIIEFMKDSGSCINMYEPGQFVSSEETEKSWFSAAKNHRKYIIADSLERYYQHDNGGIMFRSNAETVKKYEELLKTYAVGKDFVGFKTQPDLLEFSHKNSNKGYALKKLAEMRGISLDDCWAFGDTTNDNEMLKVCHGVCLLNGSDDTKACAEYITEKTIEDGGFTDFVEKHLL